MPAKEKGKPKRYRLLDYMSDALVRSYGRDLDEAFANAAVAMTAVMLDLRSVSSSPMTREVTVHGFDLQSLLYNWLEAVLVKKDIDGEVFRSAKVSITRGHSGLTLSGKLLGGPIDKGRHHFKRDVKAVTYHEMSIVKKGRRRVVTFLLDL